LRPERTILAMGGGGFSMEPDNPALDDFALSLTARPRPAICLLPTAGGDSEEQIRRFHEAFDDKPCEPTHVSLFRRGRQRVPLRAHLLAQDVIYVGGGSLVNLLAIWRAQGLPDILREAWRRGIVLAGLSAGSMCWFEWGVTSSFGEPAVAPGLGFLPGSNSVHWDGEPDRRPVYLAAVASGEVPGGWGAEDGVGLVFHGTRLAEVVSSRPHARAWRVADTGGGVIEDPLEPRLLPRPAHPRTAAAVGELRRLRALRRGLRD
jgi:peptidase E